MPERIQCEFYLLRYVPDAVKNEFVNIGVMLREAGRVETPRVQLMRLYVEPMREKTVRRKSGRAGIVASMRGEFERAGVWELMRKRIAASLYTRPGDPLKLDCGYRPNGVIRVFQAVSLEGDLEAAKVLSYSADRLRAGVERVENGSLDLAAIVEPLRSVAAEDGEIADRYRFGVETMEEAQIRVLTVNDLSRVAETAKKELRL